MERPKNYMENPYKSKDGKAYHTVEALREANRRWDEQFNRPNDLSKLFFNQDKKILKFTQ